MVKIDLHMHSTFSDGEFTPKELIDLAISQGVPAISITDHDTAMGNPEALEYAKDKDIDYVPGIEITTTPPKGCNELHIVGLFIDPYNSDIMAIKERHQGYTKIVLNKIIRKLNGLGYKINFEEMVRETGTENLSRPDLANQLIKKYPDEFNSQKEVFDKLLGQGRAAYIRPRGTEIKEVIDIIHNAGGIAIVAHPWYLREQTEQIIREFVHLGGDGLEIDPPKKNNLPDNLDEKLLSLAKKYSLIVSGGTDFHHSAPIRGKKIGERGLIKEDFDRLKKYALSKKNN